MPGLGGGSKLPTDNSGFDDFDFEDPSPNTKKASKTKDKFSAAQAALDEFDKEESEGFKISNHPANQNSKFKVNVYGIPQAQEQESDIEEDLIEEEIHTDRD